jgi:hypothetical protein
MRSISVYVVGGQSSPDLGRMFSIIAILEGLGAMTAGPVLSSLFQWGISLGPAFYGMPFLASTLVFSAITVITYMIKVSDTAAAHEEAAVSTPVDADHRQGRDALQ